MSFTESRCRVIAIAGLVLLANTADGMTADAVIHWKNGAGQSATTVLGGGGVFTTDFKGMNDAQVTVLSGPTPGLYDETFGGASPGNNPDWIKSFVGNATQGTGTGIAGVWTTLNTSASANRVQFDFSIPLAAGDRILVTDVDFTEQYQLQAFVKVGANYVAASLAGWLAQSFSGGTGVTPDTRWPSWDGATGFLTASGSGGLFEPLTVLTVDQSIDRVVFSNPVGGVGGSPTIQFASTIAGVPGDYNNNSVVDVADYVLWRKGGPLANEVDTPGIVNAQDYLEWRNRFGSTSGSGSFTTDAAVPEPGIGGLTLVLCVTIGVFNRTAKLRDTWAKEAGGVGPSGL